MKYETHITVLPKPTLAAATRFQYHCIEQGWKPLFIQLINTNPYADCPLQLMMANTREETDDRTAIVQADKLADFIENHLKFYVLRVKVETALCEGDAKYFEAHWKFSSEYNLDLITTKYKGLLHSRNLLGAAPQYLTTRASGKMDYRTVETVFNTHDKEIRNHISVDKVHYERVVFDSRPKTDLGWAQLIY